MTDLRAGAAELDITPWLGISLAGHFRDRRAESIDDPLFAKALVLDDGETRLAMVVLDILGLPRADVQAIRSRIVEMSDIPPANVMVTCTHTHTGPTVRDAREMKREEAYVEWLIRRVADVVRLAELRLQPARLDSGVGEIHGISFCRRYRMRNGTVQTNPRRGDPDIVEPVSPIDPAIGILYVEDLSGQPLAVLAQFSLHYVGTDHARHVSADYYGHFATAMRRILGPQCLPMLMNGTSGQINNVNAFDPDQPKGHRQSRRVANAVAAEVSRVIATLTPEANCRLATSSEGITLPRKTVTKDDVERAEQILANDDTESTEGRFSFVVGQPIPAHLCALYAKDCRRMYECRDAIETEVQAFRVGRSAWVALPGEIFVEIGLAIKAHSPAPETFVVGLANDILGYISTDHALKHEGGYETWASPGNAVGIGAEEIIRDAANQTLQQAFETSKPDTDDAKAVSGNV